MANEESDWWKVYYHKITKFDEAYKELQKLLVENPKKNKKLKTPRDTSE